jgi:hypothetical protein
MFRRTGDCLSSDEQSLLRRTAQQLSSQPNGGFPITPLLLLGRGINEELRCLNFFSSAAQSADRPIDGEAPTKSVSAAATSVPPVRMPRGTRALGDHQRQRSDQCRGRRIQFQLNAHAEQLEYRQFRDRHVLVLVGAGRRFHGRESDLGDSAPRVDRQLHPRGSTDGYAIQFLASSSTQLMTCSRAVF